MTQQAAPSGLILVIDDDRIQSKLMQRWLEGEGWEIELADDGGRGLARALSTLPEVVCLDLHMPGLNGMEVLQTLRERNPILPVIMLTAEQGVEPVVQAMRLGAYDYMTKPIDRARLSVVIQRAAEQHRLARRLHTAERELGTKPQYQRIVSDAEPMRAVFRQLDRLVTSDITVLVHGESGTGKELIAQAIHEHSARHNAPFVPVNCAAIPQTLQESTFFGHEKGAFTGAAERRPGCFEQANRGTLFLDEIAELSLEMQAMLLRALQEGRFIRVGGTQEISVDCRIVAASNRRLRDEVDAGRFREDLFYRLAVFELDLPALRAREGDVALLVRHFLDLFARQEGRAGVEISPEAWDALTRYTWPGNIRELRNCIQRAVVVSQGPITLDDLPPALRAAARPAPTAPAAQQPAPQPAPQPAAIATPQATPQPAPQPQAPPLDDDEPIRPLHEVERLAIMRACKHTRGNMSEAARLLAISRATLYRKLQQYDLDPEQP
jgi:DNA-binding NtrC family response regulator